MLPSWVLWPRADVERPGVKGTEGAIRDLDAFTRTKTWSNESCERGSATGSLEGAVALCEREKGCRNWGAC